MKGGLLKKRSDLILEYRQEGRQTWAIRFYQDGQVEEYNDTEMVFEDGKVISHSLPLAWRKLVRLSAAELKRVQDALRKADIFSLPEQIGDSRQANDGILHVWSVYVDGQQKMVQAYDPEASSSPGLRLLASMVQEISADAFEREAENEKSHDPD